MNTWEKRRPIKVTCQPSGNEVTARRPSPSLGLKAQRYIRVLQKLGAKENATPEEQIAAMEQLSDEELEKLTDFAAVLIADVVVDPAVSLNPKGDEYRPDDIPPADFWYIFMWVTRGCPEIPVQTEDGEVAVETVSNFPTGRGSSVDDSVNSESIQ